MTPAAMRPGYARQESQDQWAPGVRPRPRTILKDPMVESWHPGFDTDGWKHDPYKVYWAPLPPKRGRATQERYAA